MMSLTPAAIMGIGNQVGSIMPGKTANLICFDEDIRISAAWCGGMLYTAPLSPGNEVNDESE